MAIYENNNFRRVVMPLLKFFNPGTISIKHHYTGKKFSLDAFHHKGYWYHGKKREYLTMDLFEKLLKADDVVLEVGGHIGYITVYFSHLVTKGTVYVFEPGVNNLPFLEKNTGELKNVTLIRKAVSDQNGKAKFYIENLTGQNNSLLSDYENFKTSDEVAFVKSDKKEVEVETITIDTFCKQSSLVPNFIKIDIEGAELLALNGMLLTLKTCKPLIMMEITENWQSIYKIFNENNYILYSEKKVQLKAENPHSGNTFCIPSEKYHLFTSSPIN